MTTDMPNDENFCLPCTHCTVLVVEDNITFERQIGAALQSLHVPCSPTFFQTGEPAIAWLNQMPKTLDLALIDLGLPDMDGVEVVRAVRQRFSNIPILVISVISSEHSVLGAIRAGANGYLLKADSTSSIRHAIEEVLRGNYPISPGLARYLFKLAGTPSPDKRDNEFRLSPRELETLRHIAGGLSYEATAREMGVTLSTVQTNIRSLYRKMNTHSQVQTVTKARDAGLL